MRNQQNHPNDELPRIYVMRNLKGVFRGNRDENEIDLKDRQHPEIPFMH